MGWRLARPVFTLGIARTAMPFLCQRGLQAFTRGVDDNQDAWFAGVGIGRPGDELPNLQATMQLVIEYCIDEIPRTESFRLDSSHMEFILVATTVVQGIQGFDPGFCRDGFGDTEAHAAIVLYRVKPIQRVLYILAISKNRRFFMQYARYGGRRRKNLRGKAGAGSAAAGLPALPASFNDPGYAHSL